MDPDPHLVLRQVLATLSQADDHARQRDAVARLAELLPPHFADEEREGGFFDRLTAHGHRQAVAALKRQHTELLLQVEALVADAQAPGWSDALAALARQLDLHEWEESRLAATPSLLDPDHDPDRGWS